MRLGRTTPLPDLVHPARGIAFVVAGALVLNSVQGWGSLLVGSGLIAYGVVHLLTGTAQNGAHTAPQRHNAPKMANRCPP